MNMFELTFDILLSTFSDDNFGMACVIVHRIFIFFVLIFFNFSLFCYTWKKLKKYPKKRHGKIFVQIVYFNTYDIVYVLDFYTFTLFQYDRLSKIIMWLLMHDICA